MYNILIYDSKVLKCYLNNILYYKNESKMCFKAYVIKYLICDLVVTLWLSDDNQIL